MTTILSTCVLGCIMYPVLAIVALVFIYAVSGLIQLMVTQYSSHLGELRSPPVPSFFWGHLQMLHDAENTNLWIRWKEQFGTVFTYRGFIGGYRLVTMDPRAITHILSRPHEYPKPNFVRDTLASMAGEQGLLVVEGEAHKRQRKILSPSFTTAQVQALSPIFYEKATQLRDIWLAIIDAFPPSPSSTTGEDTPPPHSINQTSHKSLFAPATPILPLTPPPRVPRSPVFNMRQRGKTRPNHSTSPCSDSTFARAQSLQTSELPDNTQAAHVRVDVLNWLGRAALDVVGVAGFGYSFHALKDDRNVLAAAFAEVFSVARKFRFVMVLQAWFPILRHFGKDRKSIEKSLGTMRSIGLELIHAAQDRLAHSKEEIYDFDFRAAVAEDEKTALMFDDNYLLKGRDLLSLLIKSNIATSERERMSQDEILSQISTFMAAGHETTSSALTWTLYILAKHPECQAKLRAELADVSSAELAPEALNALPYLDMVVRESLRLHSPVSQTMRVAVHDDIIPVSTEYIDTHGYPRSEIRIKKGDIISIPIQAMNKNKLIFGEDAEQFVPERWRHPPESHVMQTLYSGILTFLQGGRACIGYKFALLEMKVFLFVLLRGIRFDPCPDLVIEKRVNVVTRPLVKSEPERGNQMPLMLSRAPLVSPRG